MVLDLGAPQVGSQTEITFLGYDLEEIEVSSWRIFRLFLNGNF